MTRHELRRGSDVKERILTAITSSRVQSEALSDRQQIKLFLGTYFADVPIEDLKGKPERVMAQFALAHLDFGATRRKGQALLRIYHPTE